MDLFIGMRFVYDVKYRYAFALRSVGKFLTTLTKSVPAFECQYLRYNQRKSNFILS